MRSKIFLASILLTPILVVTFSTLYFNMGMSPEGTKNNGIFFKSYFNFNQFKDSRGNQDLIEFEDGKWVLSVYVTDIEKSSESIYLMRQLNVALNRDINKLKRVVFPEPLGPTIVTISLALNERFMFCSAIFFPYRTLRLVTASNVMLPLK